MMHTVLNILICLASHISAERLVLNTLSDYPLALCNDGTSATYFYSEDELDNPNLLIFLQGGGACSSPEECQKRCEDDNPLCTTDTASHLDLDSTMWSKNPEENPPFHNFGRVYLPYCSSDGYSGTRTASADTNGYYFHCKQLVLMGNSAGAYGVAINCDFIAEKFHAVNKDLDVRCIADGGDFYPRMKYESCDPYELLREKYEKNIWQGVGDQSCFEGSLVCLAFPTYYNFIETPFMVVATYIDPIVHGPCTPPLNQDQDFWDNWRQEVQTMAERYIKVNIHFSLSLISNCSSCSGQT